MSFNSMKRAFSFVIFTSLVSLLFVGNLLAQSGTTGISGTVTDQTGAVVAGATVKITNPATGFTRTVTTDNDGRYNFPSIQPATYRIEIEAKSFKKTLKNDLQALVDSPIVVDLALEPGDVNAVVNVTSDSIESLINNSDATTGNNFVPQQITQLPTDLRRINDLLTLQPGVTREGYVAGARSDQSNITLDGVDVNDQQDGGRNSQFSTSQNSVLRATTESVEEFRITTTNANANQGRSSGAQISLVTKTGTNDFRGALFWFHRPTMGSANDFFNNLAGVERPNLKRNVFGGAIGGPIVKDKLFFFYTYEGQKDKKATPVTRVVPLAHLGQGQIKFNGTRPTDPPGTAPRLLTLTTAELNAVYNQIPGGMNTAAINVFRDAAARYPANVPGGGDGLNTGEFRFNSPTSDDENTHIVRIDYNLTSTQTIFARGNYQYDLEKQVQWLPDSPAPSLWEHPLGFVVGHNWSIGNNKVNNFRYGFTRQSFSNQGDSSANAIVFRFVFQPVGYTRTISRVTPTQNITDDFTWIKGNHTIQFGGNIRIIRNKRDDLGNAFDDATANPSFYDESGAVLINAFEDAGYTVEGGDTSSVQAAATALIGRFSGYSGNFTFNLDGSVAPAGTAAKRNFATEEYDLYVQDAWKPFRNLTITAGLRYGLSRPVYEKNGFQVVPSERLGDFFERRAASAATGRPLNDLIQFEKAGPANNAQGFYSMDWNNFQPRVAVAWSPSFKNGFLKTLFGSEGKTTIRGGFGVINDYFGQQLAVSFDSLSTIGFTSSSAIAANTYNVTDRLAPLFTGFGQNIRTLPNISAPIQRFDTPADEAERIETSLDGTIKSPTHYTWNVSYGRELPKGIYLQATYVGRAARNLLATRDVMAFNNLVDPASGQDWYTAARILADLRAKNTPIDQVQPLPFFANLFPNYTQVINGVTLNSTQRVYRRVARSDISGPLGGGLDILDWTFIQTNIDNRGIFPNMFVHPQYAAFSAFSSVASSDYHGAQFSLRQRLGKDLSYDINYTFSHSIDNASGLQNGASYGSQFILNALRPEDNRASSDFDVRHSVNANFLYQLPFGKGKTFASGANGLLDAIIGGWQLGGIYRWNTGLPQSAPFDQAQWATNWNVQSNGTPVGLVNFGVVRGTQNAFVQPEVAFKSFRNALPGETGPRNNFRLPGYQALDMSLGKTFSMPWSENQKLQFRWEVFNVTNFQSFDAGNVTRATYGLPQDPDLSDAPSSWGKIYDRIQGTPRRMQFGLRFSF